MKLLIYIYFLIISSCDAVSTKMDFAGEDMTVEVTNSTNSGDDDVEVKHTIVVSTKLKNNNKKGLRSSRDDNGGTQKPKKEDSGEVPVVHGYKAVDSTRIRTPDSRQKAARIYPDAVFVNRDIHRDDYDIHPNVATNPAQWKPSNFFNNIHWRSPDGREYYSTDINPRTYQNPQKYHKKISDEAVREFYCAKCVELSNQIGREFNGCASNSVVIQPRSVKIWAPKITEPKVKIDGKLAKLH